MRSPLRFWTCGEFGALLRSIAISFSTARSRCSVCRVDPHAELPLQAALTGVKSDSELLGRRDTSPNEPIVDPAASHYAILALEDGSVFEGRSFGAPAERSGELVFNTALTGYQEVFTDPCYSGQIVILTNPENRQLRNCKKR